MLCTVSNEVLSADFTITTKHGWQPSNAHNLHTHTRTPAEHQGHMMQLRSACSLPALSSCPLHHSRHHLQRNPHRG